MSNYVYLYNSQEKLVLIPTLYLSKTLPSIPQDGQNHNLKH